MIRNGIRYGFNLYFHHKQAQSLIWPDDDWHRWSEGILQTFCENDISVLIGCSDSTKTWSMSKFILTDYWAAPEKTLWLVSTTEGRGSELRIWGCIKDLFNKGREKYPDLQGSPLDYLKTITTDEIDPEKEMARSLRRGIMVIPCKTGGVVSGLAPYIGIKAPRLRHAGDEVAAMSDSFLNAYANWYGKEDFRGVMSGNFMFEDDPLGIASEPEGGWDTFTDSGKTQTWKSKFYGAQVLALDGRDSPNFDFPLDEKGRQRFPYLIGQKKLDGVLKTKGNTSWEWYSQCVGKPVKGVDIWRVLSKDFCKNRKASESVIWKGTPKTPLYSLDPAYGGGDRCVGRKMEMGEDMEGRQRLLIGVPEIIPISLTSGVDPEDQIAAYIFNRLSELSIPPRNCFYDSFGKGTLGFAFSKLFGKECPVPIDSSSMPTKRPVRFDLFVEEVDQFGSKKKRLKRCDEHYTKFVTEMWFSMREAIDTEQVRGLDAETILEGCKRKFSKNGQGKLELETKDDYKERSFGKSPDLMDNVVIGIEGARRLGLKIKSLVAETVESKRVKRDIHSENAERFQSVWKSKNLSHPEMAQSSRGSRR